MLESLNRFFAAWLSAFKSMFSLGVLGSFFLLALTQGFVLFCLVIAPSSSFGGVPIEILRSWFSPAAGHYPEHFVLLPWMFFRLSIIAYGLVGVLAYGVATGAFSRKFIGRWEYEGSLLGAVTSRYLPLMIVWAVTTAIAFAIFSNIPGWFADWTFGSPRRVIFIETLTGAGVVGFMSIFAYTTVALVIDRLPFLAAVRTSARQFVAHPLATFFLLGIPYLITVPFSMIASKSELIATKFRPETVIYALVVVILVQFFANIMTCGPVTHYYLSEPSRE